MATSTSTIKSGSGSRRIYFLTCAAQSIRKPFFFSIIQFSSVFQTFSLLKVATNFGTVSICFRISLVEFWLQRQEHLQTRAVFLVGLRTLPTCLQLLGLAYKCLTCRHVLALRMPPFSSSFLLLSCFATSYLTINIILVGKSSFCFNIKPSLLLLSLLKVAIDANAKVVCFWILRLFKLWNDVEQMVQAPAILVIRLVAFLCIPRGA
jgi:hypothetical protein